VLLPQQNRYFADLFPLSGASWTATSHPPTHTSFAWENCTYFLRQVAVLLVKITMSRVERMTCVGLIWVQHTWRTVILECN
jgi:hypothetical protein